MKKLNCKKIFGENGFFLKSRKMVDSLEIGAKLFGGATMINNQIFSNIEETNEFELKDNNKIGILVPTTMDVNKVIDNTEYVNKVIATLEDFGKITRTLKAVGSWFSDNEGIVIENSNIVEFNSNGNEFDLKLAKTIAEELKTNMSQEAISIIINDSLAIV